MHEITSPLKPQAAFRVGITGTRRIDPGAIEAVRAELSHAVRLISETVQDLGSTPEAVRAHGTLETSPSPAILRFVSPLAEGSDRMAAKAALASGYSLYCPIPFSQAEYEQDFPDTVEEFRDLLSKASVLELDGSREAANDSYREVGRFVVRNCDLLIAVWDGQQERGPGGTAEIVRFAVSLNVPIWWIHSSATQPSRFAGNRRMPPSNLPDGAVEEAAQLGKYLAKVLQPPKGRNAEGTRGGPFKRVAGSLSRLVMGDASPLVQFLSEVPLRRRGLWRCYSLVIRALTPASVKRQQPSFEHASSFVEEHWWVRFFSPIDQLANGYGDRYRSSYVLIAAFAFIAVLITTIGGLVSDRVEALSTVAETSVVALIACLLVANYVHRWHERWISYRLLAELLREQASLWSVGRSLPIEDLLQFASSSDDGHDAANERSDEAWVAWYFAAIVRSAPLLTGKLPELRMEAAATIRALIEEQLSYHRWRATSSKAVSSTIGTIAAVFFALTAATGLLKLGLLFLGAHGSLAQILTAAGVCLSAISGSFIGLRAYCDFPLLTQQSTRLVKVLKNTMSELDAIDLTEPTSSTQLGDVMNELSVSMMQDVTGWQQLFRLKSIGAGAEVKHHVQFGSNE